MTTKATSGTYHQSNYDNVDLSKSFSLIKNSARPDNNDKSHYSILSAPKAFLATLDMEEIRNQLRGTLDESFQLNVNKIQAAAPEQLLISSSPQHCACHQSASAVSRHADSASEDSYLIVLQPTCCGTRRALYKRVGPDSQKQF